MGHLSLVSLCYCIIGRLSLEQSISRAFLLLGMEVAAYLADKAKNVTCVDVCDIPFGRILGSRVGRAIQKVGVAALLILTLRSLLQLVSLSSFKWCVAHI